MRGAFRFAIIAMVSCLSLVSIQNADAFRFRRNCCCPCQHSFGGYYLCLEMELYQVGDNDYMYYAYKRQDSCDAAPSSVPFEDVYYPPSSLPQDCPAHCRFINTLEKSSGCPNHWAGLIHPVDPGYEPPFLTCATKCECHFECLKICDEHNQWKCYKVKVFDVCLPHTACPLHVAYEVTHFPDGVNPCPICIGKSNCSCPQCFIYSLCYCGKKLLLLTAD